MKRMLVVFLALAFASVATARTNKLAAPEPPERPQPTFAVDGADELTAGSLWNEVAARQLMGLDGNARQAGDLITVKITESVATNLGATTETSRKSSTNSALRALLGAEKTLRKAHKRLPEEVVIDVASEAAFRGAGATERSSEVAAVLTCEVIEVVPGGNLRVWGWKQVQVNRETQFVVLDGIVRPRDIQMDNTVSSELLAQAKIEITGDGVIADKQGPGWGARLLDFLWPF
jgi:flagellar L-ring protein FlgH